MRSTALSITAALAVVLGCCHSACPAHCQGSSAPAAAAASEAPLAELTVDQLAGILDRHEPVAIYDNNAEESYDHGHIPGARWLAFDRVTAETLGPDHDIRRVFYCHNEH